MSEGSWLMVVLQLINKSLGLLDNGTGDEEFLVEHSIFLQQPHGLRQQLQDQPRPGGLRCRDLTKPSIS